MKGYIYKITSPSNKIYIGQTTDIKKRITYYKNNHCKSQKILHKSIEKYGWDQHVMEVIKETDNVEDLNRLEIEYIEIYKLNKIKCPESNGMNLSDGGEGNRGPKSESWKNKMKDVWDSIEYQEKMKTIHQSSEWKEMCRSRQLGKKLSEDTKEKMRKKWLDIDYKNIMSEKLKKPKPKRTEEHCLNLSKSNKDRYLTDEHKLKLQDIKSNPVIQISLEGEIIKEWKSMRQIEKELKIYGISKVCSGKQKTAGGYKWVLKTEKKDE